MKNFKDVYREDVVPTLQEMFGFKSQFQVPKLEKIVLNMGVGRAVKDKKILAEFQERLGLISGQRPVVCLAKKSESGFKIREGMPIGVKVTLRSERMWSFFERLVRVAMPRILSFKGYSKRSIQGSSNISLGLSDLSIFPEDGYRTEKCGVGVTIVSNAREAKHFQALLEGLEFPFQTEERILNVKGRS